VKNEILPFVEDLITGSEYVLWIKIAKYILMMIKIFYLFVHIYHLYPLPFTTTMNLNFLNVKFL